MVDLLFLLAFYLLYGLIYNVVMVIILAAGLIAAKMKKQYSGYFIAGAIIQAMATFGNFEPILSGEADYIQLGCNLFWSVLFFLFFWQKAREFISEIRPCLKNVNKPKQRIFFRHTALIFLAIHKVLQRQIALSGEKISRRWAHFQFSNKAK